jgi:hypothetical protein
MRACAHCGHDNADHLSYCASCGRRLSSAEPADGPGPTRSASAGGEPGAETPRFDVAAFAATVAVPRAERAYGDTSRDANAVSASTSASTSASAAPKTGALGRGLDAIRYVFRHVGGRLAAEGRKRALVEERAGARRLIEGALLELGKVVLGDPTQAPELGALTEAAADARARGGAATADLASAEQFRASEDLRLDQQQATAESELGARETSAARLDDSLRQLDGQRREVEAGLEGLSGDARPDTSPDDRARIDAERAALHARRSHLVDEIAIFRERGAALRASTMAARAKLEQAIVARRQADAAVAAAIGGRARDRADAESRLREVTLEIGRAAYQRRVAAPELLSRYPRINRLEETIADRTAAIASIDRLFDITDVRKLVAGLSLLTVVVGVVGVGLWALLHRR